jgi:hypothetical protein
MSIALTVRSSAPPSQFAPCGIRNPLTEETEDVRDDEESKEEDLDEQDTSSVRNKLNRFHSQISRYDGGKNGVLRFIDDFDPASPHNTAASRANSRATTSRGELLSMVSSGRW